MSELFFPNPLAYDPKKNLWKERAFDPILCERCKTTIVEKLAFYDLADVIRHRNRKGRLIYYCSDNCQSKHYHGGRNGVA